MPTPPHSPTPPATGRFSPTAQSIGSRSKGTLDSEDIARLTEAGDFFPSKPFKVPERSGSIGLSPPVRIGNATRPTPSSPPPRVIAARKTDGHGHTGFNSNEPRAVSTRSRQASTGPMPFVGQNHRQKYQEFSFGAPKQDSSSLLMPPRLASGVGSIRVNQGELANNPTATTRGRNVGMEMPRRPPSMRGMGGRRMPSSRIPSSSFLSTRGGTGSVIRGNTTTRLSVMPNTRRFTTARLVDQTNQHPEMAVSDPANTSFSPKTLLDVENGTSMIVAEEMFLDSDRYRNVDDDGLVVVAARTNGPLAMSDTGFFDQRGRSLRDQIHAKDIRDFECSSEVGIFGGAWRGTLKRILLLSMDDVNALRISRILQFFIPFQTGYEAYLLAQLIEALDSGRKKDIAYVMKVAFQNRNVSRLLVQQVGARHDFFWHLFTQITWNRAFDAWGQLPIIGITGFPGTENFPGTRDHALASIFTVVLGEGNWITRVATQNRQGLNTTNPENVAQNLAAEANGFELANRNQFGTHVGRIRTNEFRSHHRLPTDESIYRTFFASPASTMLNNGVVHTLRQAANHWRNMLYQFHGNFGHQRQELLTPFEFLRFHMPVVLLTLSNLRGRNKWDSRVLGPFLRKLQSLKPAITAETAKGLVREMQDDIALNVCGGVVSVLDPFLDWLGAIHESLEQIEEVAHSVHKIVTSVELGIRLGHDLVTQVSWKIPRDGVLKRAVLNHIKGKETRGISERCIRSAMNLVTPRDKRTMIELIRNGLGKTKPAELLLSRTKTLLQRELRREMLNKTVREISVGEPTKECVHDEWYWISTLNDVTDGRGDDIGEHICMAVYRYDAKVTGSDTHRFIHVDSGIERFVSMTNGSVKVYTYVPAAEAISRAQKAFMTIELDHIKTFSYEALMEFTFLRVALRRLAVLSMIHCDELDNARLNFLVEIQRTNRCQVSVRDLVPGETYFQYNQTKKTYDPFVCQKHYSPSDPEWATLGRTKIVRVPPQSVIVIGGGPTGLTATLHCLENCLITGGVMKLFEARDAFTKAASTFERAQVVRLDPRWIAMLRYYLGTGFEDVYIPASGETDSQLGNTIPLQGFVEITIKDLENMLHVGISKLWSKNLIQVHTDARSNYDPETNTITKLGENLKTDDLILRRVDRDGRRSREYHSWRVVHFKYVEPLTLKQLKAGEEYGIYVRQEQKVITYTLMSVDLATESYTFMSEREDREPIQATAANIPTVYPKGTPAHGQVRKVTVECTKKNSARTGYAREELDMKVIKKEKFTLDIGHTHVIEAIGKPAKSKVHTALTTSEPYGVCCMQGLKVSLNMHNFGEKRWTNGLVDDFRSQNDQNTRIVGDFTKMLRILPVLQGMRRAMVDRSSNNNWTMHFTKLVETSDFPQLLDMDFIQRIKEAVVQLAEEGPVFRRKTLQTRFFETGDNFYLGMEFPREYDRWKKALCNELVHPLHMAIDDQTDPLAAKKKKGIERLKGVLMHNIDRLWYEAAFETIRGGDVYNPGARHRVPRLYVINSYTPTNLGNLDIGESFRLADRPKEKYEILMKGRGITVRNVEGYISKMRKNTKVCLESNLTRGPDGNQESKVAMATFPVAHYVNHRTVRLNNSERGYVLAFMGDEQASPHFMRYSGLTGACINAMSFNNFLQQAIDGVPFIDRFKLYSIETNWSNGEVVARGTGANYGVDGFLRPAFSYKDGIDYMHSKVLEHRETEQDLDDVFSRDWKVKLAASLVPRGVEMNNVFLSALFRQLRSVVFEKLITEVTKDKKMMKDDIVPTLRSQYEAMGDNRLTVDHNLFWDDFLHGLESSLHPSVLERLDDPHVFVARRLDQICIQPVDFARQMHSRDARISSELTNQPKPVDSIVDDFSVEAQNFANGLVQGVAFASEALAFSLAGS